MSEVRIVVPLLPPSVNRYVRHIRGGGHYLSPGAKAFIDAMAIFARRKSCFGKEYEVEFTVYHGKNDRGDLDNRAKLVLDSLVKAGVIHSDAAVVDLYMHKRKDNENPRTEITVRSR
jgi:Holliday junction resolvase RusA-like endonuclease